MELQCRRGNDTDNLLKLFKDILSRYYKFSDHIVCCEYTHKILVDVGCEFIAFGLSEYETEIWRGRSKKEYIRKYREDNPKFVENENRRTRNHLRKLRGNPEYRKEERRRGRESYRKRMEVPKNRKEERRYNKDRYHKRKLAKSKESPQLLLFS